MFITLRRQCNLRYALLTFFTLLLLLGLPAGAGLAANPAVIAAHGPVGRTTALAPAMNNVASRGTGPADCPGQWAVVASPSVPYSSFLEGVAVVSANDVWAVGLNYDLNSGNQRTLVEHWDGTQWNIVPSPNVNQHDNYLTAVSAVSANNVWAVGLYEPFSGPLNRPLIEHWDGAQWSIVSAPTPPGPGDSALSSVKALAANDIWAVGGFTDANNLPQTLAIHWDGSSWSTVPSPNVGTTSNGLAAIDGTGPNDLWAVGSYAGGLGGIYQTLTLHWNGVQWSIVSSPNLGSGHNQLDGVAVIAANDAWAVGFTGSYPGPFQTLALHWNGVQWSVVPTPNSPNGMSLGAVAAVSQTDVWAVGGALVTGGTSLIEHWNGTQWSIVQSSEPPGTTESALNSVAVVTQNDIWAVGSFADSTIAGQTLTEHYTSTCPANTPTSTPTDGPSPTPTATLSPTCIPAEWRSVPLATTTPDTYLFAVDAISRNDAWAVGSWYDQTSGGAHIEHWNGQGWSVVPAPVGAGIGTLFAVDAVSANDIWAVGDANLIIHWNGSQWSLLPTPQINGAALRGVDAVSANDVWAVGSSGTSIARTLIEHWDGTQWIVVGSPNVGTGHNYLRGVVAIASNNVWAVGDGSAANLILHWDGSQWQVVQSPNQGGGFNELHAVAAVGPNDIWAVGRYQYSQDGLILHWNGAEWSSVSNPPASDPILNGVAAIAANDVWVTGFDYGIRPLLEHWDGTQWSIALSPDPRSETRLWGVSGTAHDDVWTVGDNYYSLSRLNSDGPAGNKGDSSLLYAPRAFRYSGGTCQPPSSPTITPTNTRSPVLTATVVSTQTRTPTPCAINFSDVHATDYFYGPVQYLYCAGAISGYSDNTFRPYNDTTRGQLTKIVVLAKGWAINTQGGPHFTDVPTSNPFYVFVETAFSRGIISGYSDGTFRWGINVTRGQLTKIMVLAQGWELNTSGGPHFLDVLTTNPFYAFIETAYNRGIISGYSDNTFRPGNNATRGQISKIVYQAISQFGPTDGGGHLHH